MRSKAAEALVALVLAAGCLGGPGGAGGSGGEPPLRIDAGSVVRPTGVHALIEDAHGVTLQWVSPALPFIVNVAVPQGAQVVTLTAAVDGDSDVTTYLKNLETGRRRCNPDALDAWNLNPTGRHTCSALVHVDSPGAVWVAEVRSTLPTAKVVEVRFDARAPEGLASRLDLSQLSLPTHDLTPTTGQLVPSFDGTPLWVEVTLPDGPGPWPTVLASSPYNGQSGRLPTGGVPAMWEYFAHDWAKRGYAIVNADVRGFGLSGGCVEVWGPKEQADQVALVEWVATQPWSDGRVGFYGQSYVGTTPVEAAVAVPEALKAIIAVAPVINAYEDWHYGGVPNGESSLSPVAYQVLTDIKPQGTTPQEIVANAAKGVCDPTLVARANDPRAVYDAFYEERNFKQRAADVTAAVLYTQGFEDSNVKSAMIPGWFNELAGPKLGLFGHWVHQHPTRADEEVLFLGWMDQYVKGKDLGFDDLPPVEVATNAGTLRAADSWPTGGLAETRLYPDFRAGTLGPDPTRTTTDLLLTPADSAPATGNLLPLDAGPARIAALVTAGLDVGETFAASGVIALEVRGTLQTQGNAHLAAYLYDVSPEGRWLVTYGMFNLAHERGHDRYEPVVGRTSDVVLPFLPTEWVFGAGHRIEVDLRATQADADFLSQPERPGVFTIGEHPQGNGALVLPVVPLEAYVPMTLANQP